MILLPPIPHMPRLLILATDAQVRGSWNIIQAGSNSNLLLFQGQRTYLGPALLHMMEMLPCVKLDIPALFSNSARSPEEAITQLIHTARRTQPGVLYIPHLLTLWDTVGSSFELGT